MAYGQEGFEKKSAESPPHADCAANVEFFHKTMCQVLWLPNRKDCPVKYEIYNEKRSYIVDPEKNQTVCVQGDPEYLNVVFIFPSSGSTQTFNISFHQNHRRGGKDKGFADQLCAALNRLAKMRFLMKDPQFYSSPKEKDIADSKWRQLFGKDFE